MTEVRLLSLATALVLAGCATLPTSPSVMVLPGTGKHFEQFQADEAVCRQWALQQIGARAGSSTQRSYDIAYMQCMYSKGNQIPVHAQFQSPARAAPELGPQPPVDIPPPPPGNPPPPPPGV